MEGELGPSDNIDLEILMNIRSLARPAGPKQIVKPLPMTSRIPSS